MRHRFDFDVTLGFHAIWKKIPMDCFYNSNGIFTIPPPENPHPQAAGGKAASGSRICVASARYIVQAIL